MRINRPQSDEYDEFYAGYLEAVGGDDARPLLTAQLDELTTLVGGLSDEQARQRYGEGKWSIKEVLGHLCDSERVFSYRAMSIARGEAQNLPGFEQDDYVSVAEFDRRPLESLLWELRNLRGANAILLESLNESELTRRGQANGVEVSVRALAWIMVGHMAHHLEVLKERYLPAS